jgi:hypothetical protein
MAEYFDERESAEQFMHEWFAKDGKPPVHFAKIFNNGREKWIVNYDPRQSPHASPAIKVLEDHSNEIQSIVRTPWPERQRLLQQERVNEERRGKEQQEREEKRRKDEREREEKVKRENERIESIKQRRAAQGVCLMCGGGLGFIDKLFRRRSHGSCKQFRD